MKPSASAKCKKKYNFLSLFSDNRGFTLVEILVVITIMVFMAAMVVPFAGHIGRNQRIRATEARLKEIKIAIIGMDNVYDEQGFPIVRGYVGDLGELPKLYASTWLTDQWVWPLDEVVNDGKGQPRGLWEKPTNGDNWINWKGSGLSLPTDPFPDDAKKFDSDADRELFKKRQNHGKLSDAWGISLLFWKQYVTTGDETTATLWIISEGPDKKSLTDEMVDGGYDEAAATNKDNIVVKITPNQWYRARNFGKEERTREILKALRKAIIGRVGAVDDIGRKNVEGYLGDLGIWPKLYTWAESDPPGWVWVSGAVYGQPVDLWRQETDPRWKGPYINEPWGKGKDQLIRDAWGNAIKFKMKGTVSEAAYLRVLSDGIDQGNFVDDLFIDIHAHEWQEGSLPIMDQKKTQDTEEMLERIQKALLGPEAFDASGRRIIGGYLGDLGNWPEIHNKWAVNEAVYGQPINLWLDEAGAGNGFHWRGPYIPKPANQLKDAWGNPIGFKLASDELFIVSGGPDGDLSKAKDNISKVIQKSDWQAAELTVQGWIHNDRPDKKSVTVTISVYHRPKDDVTADVVATEVYAPGASSVKFNVVANGIICGKRMLVLVDGIQRQVRNIFIGAGGTQSPAEDRLKFYLR